MARGRIPWLGGRCRARAVSAQETFGGDKYRAFLMNVDPSATSGAVIAFVLRDLEGGGAERAIVGLACELARRGYAVDLVLGNNAGDYAVEIAGDVRIVDLSAPSPVGGCLALRRYLRSRRPDVVMSALDMANIMLMCSALLAGFRGRKVVSQRAVVGASLNEYGAIRRRVTKALQRMCFGHADAVISNSVAAARDVEQLLGVSGSRIHVIPNGIDVGRIARLGKEPINSGVLPDDGLPLIVSVGSLSRRKDFQTLIRAFAIVNARRRCRLALVGKGEIRGELERLIGELGLREWVHLPGFDLNPHKWVAASAVFVSSSTGEGFPNVIAEALALGRPIVATNCPGGTAELLEHGKWGRLVPVGDAVAMAEAILLSMADGGSRDGRVRASEFSPDRVATAYLKVLLPCSIDSVDQRRRLA